MVRCRWSGKAPSPARGQSAKRLLARVPARCRNAPRPEGMQRGTRERVTLAKIPLGQTDHANAGLYYKRTSCEPRMRAYGWTSHRLDAEVLA